MSEIVWLRAERPSKIVRNWALALTLGASVWAGELQPVAADGAFADSKTILLPKTQPHRILVSSDISGLLVSDDDGASWSWICEDAIGQFSALFQLGAVPDERLYAITRKGLVGSPDGGCTWSVSTGVGQRASDVFPDPDDPARVLIVSQSSPSEDAVLSDVVAESSDQGQSFGPPQFATATASITGLELARADSALRYLTMSGLELQHPFVVRSSDRGATWTSIDLSHQLGLQPYSLRILAVDPDAARSLYLRLSTGPRDALGISRDGGDTVRIALQLGARMTAFLRRSDGALIVASSDGQASISRDGGETFSAWPANFHISALAERDGRVYATANNKLDGFAFAVSTDGGEHWQPRSSLSDVRGPSTCGSIAQLCSASWTQLAPSLAAIAARPITEADAAMPAAHATQSAPPASSPTGSGCSIAAPSQPQPRQSLPALFAGAWAALRARRRRR